MENPRQPSLLWRTTAVVSPARALPSALEATERVRSWPRQRRWPVVLALCAVAILVPALISWASGSLLIPQIDGWSYRRTAAMFSATGSFSLTGYAAMTLIGQVLWSWPFLRLFGTDGWGFAVSTAVLATVGIASAYYVSRTVLSPRRAVASVLLLVLAPGFAWGTSTFMTDVPTTSSELLCLALGVAALARRGAARWALLVLALVAGAFGFAIREFALLAPVAVVLCLAAGDERRARPRYVLAGVLELAGCGALYLWWLHVPGGVHQPLLPPSWFTLVRLVQAYFTLAFMLCPVLAVVAWRRLRALALRRALPAGMLVVLLGEVAARYGGSLFVGDFLMRRGAVGTLLLDGSRPVLFPQPLWDLVSLAGLLAGGVLAALAFGADAERLSAWRAWGWATPAGLLRTFAILFAIGSTLYLLGTSMLWDRYLWPLVFVLGVLLLRGEPTAPERRAPAVALAGAAWVLLALVTTMLTVNADTYAAARWRAGQQVVARGVPAAEVDAGFAWVGAHSHRVAGPALRAAPPYESWYARIQPGFHECALVSGSPLTDKSLRPIGVASYRLYGAIGPLEHFYRYRVTGC